MKRFTLLSIAAVFAGVTGLVWVSWPNDHDHSQNGMPDSRQKAPAQSKMAEKVQVLFNTNCPVCDGKNATGTKQGPPLMHKNYDPSHHGDASFLLAANNGVRAHHWPFGNMPPVAGFNETEVKGIIAFVRELQRANGIR